MGSEKTKQVAQSYKLTVQGYKLADDLPKTSGIYLVFVCSPTPSPTRVIINKLIYIGQAKNLNERVSGHEGLPAWEKHLSGTQKLCFAYIEIEDADIRTRCEAALIFEHQPPENSDFKNNFPFDDTFIQLDGETLRLNLKFTVKKSITPAKSA